MIRRRLIAAFPATGKSYYAERHLAVVDSDSTAFSWIGEGTARRRHPLWPHNYLERIKADLLDGKTVLVSTHAEARALLTDEELPFTLVYPQEDCRVEYLVRMAQRGSPLPLIELVDKNWAAWIAGLREQPCAARFELEPGQYLMDVIR